VRVRRSAPFVLDFTVHAGVPSDSGALELDDSVAFKLREGPVERGAGWLVAQRAAEIALREHVSNLFEGGFDVGLDLPLPPPLALRLGGRSGRLRRRQRG